MNIVVWRSRGCGWWVGAARNDTSLCIFSMAWLWCTSCESTEPLHFQDFGLCHISTFKTYVVSEIFWHPIFVFKNGQDSRLQLGQLQRIDLEEIYCGLEFISQLRRFIQDDRFALLLKKMAPLAARSATPCLIARQRKHNKHNYLRYVKRLKSVCAVCRTRKKFCLMPSLPLLFHVWLYQWIVVHGRIELGLSSCLYRWECYKFEFPLLLCAIFATVKSYRCHLGSRQVRDPTAYIMRAARQRGKGRYVPGLGYTRED